MLTEEKICKTILHLVKLLLNDDLNTRGCRGTGKSDDLTIKYNFDFRIIDNETGEEM